MRSLLPGFLLLLMSNELIAQTETNRVALKEIQSKTRLLYDAKKEILAAQAKEKGWSVVEINEDGGVALLTDIDEQGYPIYTSTDNLIAAETIGTSLIQEGGKYKLNLSGSSAFMTGKLGLWDGGSVYSNHQELIGRIVARQPTSSFDDHATHVAGTMIGKGIFNASRGMANGMHQLIVYDFDGDLPEMAAEAPNLLMSNHSYGTISGWYYNSSQSRWEFRGRFGENEDYKFGWYNSTAQIWDSIAYNAPYYLIFKSAGNNRNTNGPEVGATYWRYNSSGVMSNAGSRPPGLSSNNGYDIIATYGTAKNIVTVGAVSPIPGGYKSSSNVVVTSFSSWGPTDDGRIKPDIVAMGEGLVSTGITGATSYTSKSGTSMATPNASGSAFLLQELYAQHNNNDFMLSSTLKALLIHTADEAGSTPGPDYVYGWGLLNIGKAADVIRYPEQHTIYERTYVGNDTSFIVYSDYSGKLTFTMVWTDPPGRPNLLADNLNDPTPKLIHDLDISVTGGMTPTTYYPWRLNGNDPSAAATKGVNSVDNVEKIEIDDVVANTAYIVNITHKGVLERSAQTYSLIISGGNGNLACPPVTGDETIVNIGTVEVGGTTYTNSTCTNVVNRDVVATLRVGEANQIEITPNYCDVSNQSIVYKGYIDYNHNYIYEEDEVVFESEVLSAQSPYTTSFNIPANATMGRNRLRIFVIETNDPDEIQGCSNSQIGGGYDIFVDIANSSYDIAVNNISFPSSEAFPNKQQFITVNVENTGSQDLTNVPLTLLVKQNDNTLHTITENTRRLIRPDSVIAHTFQTPIDLEANTSYEFTVFAALDIDGNRYNDTILKEVTTIVGEAPSATATTCNEVDYTLRVSASSSATTVSWYQTLTESTPFMLGNEVKTTVTPEDGKFYYTVNESATLGPKNNTELGTSGQYHSPGGAYIRFSAKKPFVIQSAKLYVQSAGYVELLVGRLASISGTSYSYYAYNKVKFWVNETGPEGEYHNINLPVLQTGDSVIVIITRSTTAIFYSNYSIVNSPYPAGLPGLVEVSGNSNTNSNSVWYALYDMTITGLSPASERSTVNVTVEPPLVITLDDTRLTSNKPGSHAWYKDGVLIPSATFSNYTPVASGVYTATYTNANGCTFTSNSINFVYTSVEQVDPSEIGLKVNSNPNNGQFTVDFRVNTVDQLVIRLVNTAGQPVFQKQYNSFIGRHTETINVKQSAKGVYYLVIEHDNKRYVEKILIQ